MASRHTVKIQRSPTRIAGGYDKPKESITFRHSTKLSLPQDNKLQFMNQAVALAKQLGEDEQRKPTDKQKVYFARKVYPTASVYEGHWKHNKWNGQGSYRFPHGVRITGNFNDSRLHGAATLQYPAGQQLETLWDQGVLRYWKYTFADGLYYTDPWHFCQFPDRRYAETHKHGFAPPGEERVTTEAQNRTIPKGCFDAGEGFYDPQLHCIVDARDPTKIIRIPTREEEKNIIKQCRTWEEKPIGYCPELYEEWTNGTQKSMKEIRAKVCVKGDRCNVMFHS